MANDESIERHYAALRQVMADPDMNPRGPYATISQEQYFDNSGARPRSTSERRALHRQWIQEVIDTNPNAKEQSRAYVMAGPPGAGKSFLKDSQLGGLEDFIVCDPDHFKAKILEHELSVAPTLSHLKPQAMKDLEAQGEMFAPLRASRVGA